MELILTDAEKKSATWLELDNESIGKLVKAILATYRCKECLSKVYSLKDILMGVRQ